MYKLLIVKYKPAALPCNERADDHVVLHIMTFLGQPGPLGELKKKPTQQTTGKHLHTSQHILVKTCSEYITDPSLLESAHSSENLLLGEFSHYFHTVSLL